MSTMSSFRKNQAIAPFDSTSGQSFRDYVLKQTMTIHQQAEDSRWMHKITSGEVTKSEYARYVGTLYFIYQHLEQLAEKPDVPESIRMFVRQVARATALATDYKMLTDFSINEQQSSFKKIKALNNYVTYLDQIAHEPFKLLAHLYVRYGGDMAGGRVIRKKLLDMEWDASTLNFFDLGDKDQLVEFRKNLHNLLNRIPENYHGNETAFVEESMTSFEQNIAILEELS